MKFSECVSRIEGAYHTQGHSLGWRFLYSPESTFCPSIPLLLLALNPGGGHFGKPQPSTENGNAYRAEVEQWTPSGKPSTLQKQVCLLFELLGPVFEQPTNALMDSTMCANLIPFRSRSLGTLPRSESALAFARDLWNDIFKLVDPTTVICIGRQPFQIATEILEASQFILEKESNQPSGWGKVSVGFRHFRKNSAHRLVIGLPHLSRFAIFGREQDGRKFEREIVKAVTRQQQSKSR